MEVDFDLQLNVSAVNISLFLKNFMTKKNVWKFFKLQKENTPFEN